MPIYMFLNKLNTYNEKHESLVFVGKQKQTKTSCMRYFVIVGFSVKLKKSWVHFDAVSSPGNKKV